LLGSTRRGRETKAYKVGTNFALPDLQCGICPQIPQVGNANPKSNMEVFAMQNPVRFAVLFLCLISVATVLGCAGSRTSQTTGEMVDDSVIAAKVKAALYADDEVKGTQVEVETFKGTVQLSGFVDTQIQSQKAERIARGVRGVKAVKNNITVK
jgi:hypothetical protein